MSLSEKMLDIIDELESRFQAINGSDDYHNEIDHNLIYLQHMSYQEAEDYPAISISSFETSSSRQQGLAYRFFSKNSSADRKVSTAKPTDLKSISRLLMKSTSSSTIYI